MKKLFIMLAAAATVASCAKESTVMEAPGQAIEFGNVFVDNATRVAAKDVNDPSYNSTSLNHFNVYGTINNINIYNGNAVTKGEANYGAAWTVENNPNLRWIAGANYKFAAVVDATSVTSDANGMPTSLGYDADDQNDMLYDYVERTGKDSGNDIVAFNFTHLLSKVKFSVTNNTDESADNYQYVVKNIEFTNANLTGKYNININNDGTYNGTWTVTKIGEYTDIADLTVASNSTEYAANEVLLIPGLNDTDKVGMSFTIQPQIKDSENNWVNVGTAIEFEDEDIVKLVANTAYHFHITVGLNNTIQFTANALPSWADGDGADDTTLTL